MLVRPEWWPHAACAGVGPEVFFDPTARSEEAAKAICASCEVLEPCRAWAIEQQIGEGVFGGLTATERRQERRLEATA
jgi:WhiB family transcriptional regulator, redox-sensing transcriptional regulator